MTPEKISLLRQAAAAWFNDRELLALEELITEVARTKSPAPGYPEPVAIAGPTEPVEPILLTSEGKDA